MLHGWRIVLPLTLFVACLAGAAHGQSYPTVRRIIDGDTVVLSTGEKVRLIGVDTPEIVHPGKRVEPHAKEASDFLKRFILGRHVQVRYDRQRYDRHRRTLAYLYLMDGTLINSEIIRRGYGHVYTRYPFAHMAKFLGEERSARNRKVGIWTPKRRSSDRTAPVMGRSSQTVYLTRTGIRYHMAGCRYLARSRIPVTRGEALSRGYTPCLVCASTQPWPSAEQQAPPAPSLQMPAPEPSASGDTIYVTRTGSKYHRGGCRYLARSQIPMGRADAISAGYGPCSICSP